MAGSGVKPSSDSALRDASSDSARARISLVASKALTAESAESLADASDALTASTELGRRRGGEEREREQEAVHDDNGLRAPRRAGERRRIRWTRRKRRLRTPGCNNENGSGVVMVACERRRDEFFARSAKD